MLNPYAWFIFMLFLGSDMLLAQTNPSWIWARQAEVDVDQGFTNSTARSIVTDSAGNNYVTGSYGSPKLTMGSFVLTNPSPPMGNMYVAKYDSAGNVLWAITTVGTYYCYGQSVALSDSANKLYLTGMYASFNNAGSFGTHQFTNGDQKQFVARLDPATGNVIWVKEQTGTARGSGSGICTYGDSTVYVCGNFSQPNGMTPGTATFGSLSVNAYLGGFGGTYLLKLDDSGNEKWVRTAGANYQHDVPSSVCTDYRGDVYITGYMNQTMVIDTVTFNGNQNVFVAKYNAAGNFKWVRFSGGSNNSYNRSTKIVSDIRGNIYVTGWYLNTTFSFGAYSLSNTIGDYKVFVAKFDAAGTPFWLKNVGVVYNTGLGPGIITDRDNNYYVTGCYGPSPNYTANIGGITLTSTGIRDLFVAKFDSAGTALWAQKAGGTYEDYAQDVGVDYNGGVYVVGCTQSAACNFGTHVLYARPTNPFIAKIGVEALIDAQFNANITSVCASNGVNFQDQSTGSPTSWRWSFEGGNPSSSQTQNPTVTYANPGTYFVKLVVTNASGSDSLTKTTYIKVDSLPEAGVIAGIPDSVCAGDSSLLSVSGSFGSIQWQSSITGTGFNDVPGASSTSLQTPALTQTVYYRVKANNQCGVDSTIPFPIVVNPLPSVTASADDTLFCASDSAQICATGVYPVYLWNTGESTSCIYTKNAGGYWLSVTDANGCSNTSNRVNLNVYPIPPISVVVQGDTLSSFGAVSYQWLKDGQIIPGATSPLYIAQESAEYSLRVTDANGCQATSSGVDVILNGIAESAKSAGVYIYPLPSSGEVIISFEEEMALNEIRIINMLGQQVKRINIPVLTNKKMVINISDLPSGVFKMILSGKSRVIYTSLLKN